VNGLQNQQILSINKMMPDLIAILLGLFVGIVLSLTGAGGAVLSIPLLVFFLHLSISEAAPIGLFALMLSAGIGALLGLRAGTVRYKAAGLMALLGMAMAPVGVFLGHYLPSNLVGILFSIVLTFVAWRMWRGSPTETINAEPAPCQINPATSKLFWTAPCTAKLGLAGSIAGLLSGLLGVGGGFIIVPSLHKVSNLNIQTIIATSLAVVALVSSSSFLTYALHYSINWRIAIPFGISTIIGMLVGRVFASKIPTKYSQRVFAVLAFVVAIALAIKHANLI
jgi:uncharacterized protein